MASSFDTEQASYEDGTYHAVMALYSAIKDTPGIIRVRRAQMRQGEVQAEAIDFIIDVELKAKRLLINDPFGKSEWEEVLQNPSQYANISEFTRRTLGHTFNEYGLGVDGAYKMLYWRIKNYHQKLSQEITNEQEH